MSTDEYIDLPLEKKRSLYKCGEEFVELSSIPTWKELSVMNGDCNSVDNLYPVDEDLNKKVSLFTGDITCLEIDAIVNTAKRTLLGVMDERTVDGAIHHAAGIELREECRSLNGCQIGNAKTTSGYRLPARYVIHTVGPHGENKDQLDSCYKECFKQMKAKGLRTIAFPCISTGVLCYPNEAAAHVALKATRKFLETGNNAHEVDRVIFCLFRELDIAIYNRLMQKYFPLK